MTNSLYTQTVVFIQRIIRAVKILTILGVLTLAFAGADLVYGSSGGGSLTELLSREGSAGAIVEQAEAGIDAVLRKHKERNFEELIQSVPPKYGVPPVLAEAIVEQESNGRRDAVRFEPGQMGRARKCSKDPAQQRMFASSHCAFQIMGWHAPRYGITWSDLYDPETCVEVAMAILKDCLDKHEGKPTVEQFHGALACYNGSTTYADHVLNRLGRKLIAKTLG